VEPAEIEILFMLLYGVCIHKKVKNGGITFHKNIISAPVGGRIVCQSKRAPAAAAAAAESGRSMYS
jgi:hypothetical protein